jgi:hypothetical protein
MRPYYLGLALPLAGCAVQVVPITPSASPAIVRKVAEFDDLPHFPTSYAFDSSGSAWSDCEGTVLEVPPGGEPQRRFFSNVGMLGAIYITGGDQLWQTVSASGVQKLARTGEVLQMFAGPSIAMDPAGFIWAGYQRKQGEQKYVGAAIKLAIN